MNYKHRCKITFSKKVPGYLGEEEVKTETKVLVCGRSYLSESEQISMFGKYTNTAIKIHLQGHWENINDIEFEGGRRNLFTIKHHRNSTVVVVS
ncbi:hypothetical protein OEZ17_17575 [Enterococcus avium]|uniref:hypothetical protein n=1 Tax=Enterococcus avium TaxID=33945 RepID=UPI0025AF7552|nr:hypothetical protein [Enterococcus avium]MDN2639314.1 hypothetical protein [Enterococcus avium]